MFCKNCGGPIDRATMKCTKCGQKAAPLAGGSGFRDMLAGAEAGKPAPEAPKAQPAPKEQPARKTKTGSSPKWITPLLALVAVAAIALLIVACGKIGALKEQIEELENEALTERDGGKESELPDRFTEDETQPPEDGAELADPREPAETPEAAETPEPDAEAGRGAIEPEAEEEKNELEVYSSEDKPSDDTFGPSKAERNIFTYTVKTVDGLSFEWQRKNAETGEWEEVDGENYRCGTTAVDGNTLAWIKFIKPDESQAGFYRCIARAPGYEDAVSRTAEASYLAGEAEE